MTLNELFSMYSENERIKRGGMKTVYRVTKKTGELIALKLMSGANNPRNLQEIEVMRKLCLDNVPSIINSGVVIDDIVGDELLYVEEEFIEGMSLRDWLNLGNRADLSKAYNILKTLLNIEVELEKSGILHRDIKPDNIIERNDGKLYLIDFGIAKVIGGDSFTLTSAAMGPCTPGYAPHEQIANQKMKQDVRTDLYEIGVTIYEICTGINPFRDLTDDLSTVIAKTVVKIPEPLRLEGDTNGLFSSLIAMLMAKNVSQRPDTALDALKYLDAIRLSLIMGE
ncbi:MAG: serine/threonine protein kinase [Lachnospiraceae bacterium]|nr:serine/threonine protein kinase [Lachnospiraceae bacterium]